MRTDSQRIEKYTQKMSGDIAKLRTDAYRDEQVKNYSALAGNQVMLERYVKEFMSKWGLPSLHTNYYMLFLKKLLSVKANSSQEEANIEFNKWAARGIPFYFLRYIGRKFCQRLLDLKSVNKIPGLEFHATLYEGEGSIIHDLSGNNRDGVLAGNGWTTDAVIGSAIDFGAGTGEYIKIDHDPAFSIAGKKWSIVFWMKGRLPLATPPFENLLFGKCESTPNPITSPGTGEYGLIMDDTFGILFLISDGVQWLISMWIPIEHILPLIGPWAFCGFTHDGTTGRVYANGELLTGQDFAYTGRQTTSPLWFGGTDAPGNPFQCNGITDEIRFYSRCLSLEEIKLMYEGER